MGILFSLITALCTACAINVGKKAMSDLPFITFGIYLSLFASIYSGIALLATRNLHLKKTIRQLSWPFAWHIVFFSIGIWLFWQSIATLHPGVASFVNRSEIIFTIILASIFLGERLTIRELLGAGIVIFGLTVIASPHFDAMAVQSTKGEIAGITCMLLGSLGISISEIFSKKSLNKLTPLHFTFLRNVFLCFVYILIAVIFQFPLTLDTAYLAIALATSLFGPTLGRLFYMKAIHLIDMSKVSIFTQAQPLFATIIGYHIYHQSLNPIEWLGGFMIIFGCVSIAIKRKKI